MEPFPLLNVDNLPIAVPVLTPSPVSTTVTDQVTLVRRPFDQQPEIEVEVIQSVRARVQSTTSRIPSTKNRSATQSASSRQPPTTTRAQRHLATSRFRRVRNKTHCNSFAIRLHLLITFLDPPFSKIHNLGSRVRSVSRPRRQMDRKLPV